MPLTIKSKVRQVPGPVNSQSFGVIAPDLNFQQGDQIAGLAFLPKPGEQVPKVGSAELYLMANGQYHPGALEHEAEHLRQIHQPAPIIPAEAVSLAQSLNLPSMRAGEGKDRQHLSNEFFASLADPEHTLPAQIIGSRFPGILQQQAAPPALFQAQLDALLNGLR